MSRFDALQPFEQWGTIAVQELGERHLPRSGQAGELEVHRERHVWRPRASLDLDSGFELALECEEGPDTIRRWTPVQADAFVFHAALAGQAILEQAGLLTKEQGLSYHAMRLIFQLSPRNGAYLRRQFKRKGDLLVARAARIDSTKPDILPTDLGCGPDGRGAPWSVKELLAQGRQAAMKMEVDASDEALVIRLGLFEAARLNPLKTRTMTNAEIRCVIRMGLFDFEDLSPVEAHAKAIVTERLLTALQNHHIEDPPDIFRKWFFEAVDNIVHQIAKKKRDGGQVAREVVRQAILEITFDAFDYVAGCVHVAMRAFAGALLRPLEDAERNLFSLCYFRPTALGEFPLIMLHDRLPALREGVIDLISSPLDERATGAVLQMLRYFGEMSHNLRLADKLRKRNRKARNDQGRPALRLVLGADIPAGKRDGEGQSLVITSLLDRRKAECRCATTKEWEIIEYPGDTEAVFEIPFQCRRCDHTEMVETSRQELLDIKRSLQ